MSLSLGRDRVLCAEGRGPGEDQSIKSSTSWKGFLLWYVSVLFLVRGLLLQILLQSRRRLGFTHLYGVASVHPRSNSPPPPPVMTSGILVCKPGLLKMNNEPIHPNDSFNKLVRTGDKRVDILPSYVCRTGKDKIRCHIFEFRRMFNTARGVSDAGTRSFPGEVT